MKNLKKLMYKKYMKKVYHHIITLTLVFQGFVVYQLTVISVLIYAVLREIKEMLLMFVHSGSGIISNIGYPKFSMKNGTSGVIQNWRGRL